MASYVDIIKNAQTDFYGNTLKDVETVIAAFETTDPNHERRFRLAISTPTRFFEPPIKDEVTIEWERTNTPGKMTFTTIKVDGANGSFHEGDKVYFATSEQRGDRYSLMFVGYVFKKSRDKRHHIEVTCYDQLRYLKNKYSWVFTNQTASQILNSICKDYGLEVGAIAGTKYNIPSIAKENAEAFDVIIQALEETLANTGQMYVLEDRNGSITLQNVLNKKLNRLIDSSSAQNFEYTSDIDTETYNSIVLYYKPGTNSGVETEEVDPVIDSNKATNAANWAIGIANDNSHGYSQANRWGPDYDCSSLVVSAYEQAGVPMKSYGITYSGSMTNSKMQQAGFTDVTSLVTMSNGTNMKVGDILWKSGHVAMYIGNGRLVEASSNRGHPQTGDQTGTEIKTDNMRSGFTKCFRYSKG